MDLVRVGTDGIGNVRFVNLDHVAAVQWVGKKITLLMSNGEKEEVSDPSAVTLLTNTLMGRVRSTPT